MEQMKWKKSRFKGVRYREHPARKHGLHRDRYFAIRYQKEGKRVEEGLGWESEGWTEGKAIKELQILRESATRGEGYQRLSEKRAAENRRREREQVRGITFGAFFEDTYMPIAKIDKKENSVRTERVLYDNWVKPVIGKVPLFDVSAVHIQKIKQNLLAAKRAPATVRYVLAAIRQVFNQAKKRGVYSGDHPVSKVAKPRVDNARLRYLTPDEIATLLPALRERSLQVHDEALLAVNCGLRFSEVAGLTADDVNFETGMITIRDAKTGSGIVFINSPEVDVMLRRRIADAGRGLLFPDTKGQRQRKVSKTFLIVANALFNKGITDSRLRVSFHTLRHTFGTLVYGASHDIYATQKAMRHTTPTMTMRYAKMSPDRLRETFRMMGDAVASGKIQEDANDEAEQKEKRVIRIDAHRKR